MYVNILTKEILGLGALRKLFPKISFPILGPNTVWLTDNGYAVLINTDKPTITSEESTLLDGVEKIDGNWKTKWTIRAKTLEEKTIEWKRLMGDTDHDMTRTEEEIIKASSQPFRDVLPQIIMDKYNAKIALRATKPT